MSDMTAAEPGPPAGAPEPGPSAGPPGRRRARPSRRHRLAALEPLLWIGPAIALIAVVVLWPIVTMVQTSFQNITPLGITIGSAGVSNFSQVFKNPNLPGILVRTVIWVAASVAITMVISLGLAQLYNSNQADWLGRPDSAFVWMIAVAVFVSLPFTTYVLLAGLQSIPGELFEASRVDGASSWHAYRRITLPLLRPAFLVALVINLMNVFNSFPLIWEMTRGGPGYETSTTTVFMYDLKGTFVGQAAAMSIVNFTLVVIIVLVFLRLNRWNRQEAA